MLKKIIVALVSLLIMMSCGSGKHVTIHEVKPNETYQKLEQIQKDE
ncbi:MAG: hypothetical protein LBN08_02060 [Lactobacillales bacterium]|jgi:hypothetical protein|nr:hypothetical protein [Lactobacillales bacterium]